MSKRQEGFSTSEITFSCYPFGVGNYTEGVCLLLTVGKYRILLDCGLTDITPLCVSSQPPADWVFCSHAHEDHARGLLELRRRYQDLPIYTSEVTAKLLPLNWLTEGRIPQLPPIAETLPWHHPIALTSDLTVELFPAGHLPGASCFLFKYHPGGRVYKIFYTGDFCLSHLQLVEGLSLDSLRGLNPDVLIIEGSYGTARHPHRRHQEKQLMTRIKQAIDSGVSVILPLPTFGLAQEILKLLRSHHEFTGKDLDIWVDGNIPLACDLYLELLDYFPENVRNFAKHQPLFWDEKIKPRMRRVADRKREEIITKPSIVLTDKLSHLKLYCQNPEIPQKWLVLVPYHSKISQAGEIREIRERSDPEKVIIEDYILAEHSDGRNTTQLIHNLKPQHIIFVHGLPNYLADLTSLEELQNRYQLHSPEAGVRVELPIGAQFIQPKMTPQTTYEGELNETGAYITITLPEQISRDPRWQNFADTGLVEARWQGEELVIRGLSQRELLQQNSLLKRQLHPESCGNCRYYREQYCYNEESPLRGFNVPPDGYCPLFEPRI